MAFSSSKRDSASALLSSVLPYARGPRNMKEPMGLFSSCPARARRTASDTALTACFCPMTRGPEAFLHVDELGASLPAGVRRNAGPGGDHLGDVRLRDFLLQQASVRLLHLVEFFLSSARARSASAVLRKVIFRGASSRPSAWPVRFFNLEGLYFFLFHADGVQRGFSLFHWAIIEPDFSFRSASFMVISFQTGLLSRLPPSRRLPLHFRAA